MFRKTLTAIAFTALTVGSANALTIDTFNTTQSVSDAQFGGPTVDTVTDGINILGADRTVSVEQNGPGTTNATASFNTNPGLLTLGNTDALSETNILYAGAGGAGLGGVDLTEGGTDDRFSLFQVAGDFPTDITISVTDTSANSGSFMISSVGLGLLVPLELEYSSFSGSVDFTLIDTINIQFETNNDLTDLRIDFFGTTSEIAEPGVLAILGLGLAGLGFARRRRS